jgi:homoserine O-acetyltransferase
MPTLQRSDEVLDAYVTGALKNADANDVLYQLSASQDYDPAPALEKISAPLVAINFADDLINPPELGILEQEIKRVPGGKAILIPMSSETAGHGTHTLAKVWEQHLADLLKQSERR